MGSFVPGAGIGPVSVVSRSADKLDAFAVGLDGKVYTAAWEPGDTTWRGWWQVGTLEVAPCAPVSAVSRSADKLDIFVVGINGSVFTAAWEKGDTAWRGWRQVGSLETVLHAPINAVSRAADKLDIFVTGLDGRVYTAAWQPGDTTWRGWWQVGAALVPPGAPVGAVSRSTDKLDIFVTGLDGQVYTAAWQPGDANWRGWWQIGSVSALPRTQVSAVSRSKDMLDIFIVGADRRVYTAAWKTGDSGWRGWWLVGTLQAVPRTPVSVVSRSLNKLDIFTISVNGKVWTASWKPGNTSWTDWIHVANGQSVGGNVVSAVSRSAGKLDVVTTGTDGKVYTAAWASGDAAWRGWWPIGNLTPGMTDPGVASWHEVGMAFKSENTIHSEEAQGISTDGSSWFFTSNGSKMIRKYGQGAQLLGQAVVWNGAHVGALGCHSGWVYVAVQKPFGVWKARTDLSSQSFTLADGGTDRFSWCDVNPLNGRLYTCEFGTFHDLDHPNGKLFAYDRVTIKRCPEDDIYIGGTPIHFDRIQGGVFTRRGRLIICRSGPNGVFCFSAITGMCLGAKHLGDFGSELSELESVTVRSWQFNGVPAQVHLLELDNDITNKDDCYLHSFQVPEPAFL